MLLHDRLPRPVPNGPGIAERLLAYARLCRQIAEATASKELAQKFARLADECARLAAEIDPDDVRPRVQ